MRKLLRIVVVGLGVAVTTAAVLFLVVGPIWEQYRRRQAALEFPAPGKLVNIGGRLIQIDCRGTGSPTVVFESGLDVVGSLSWTKVHAPVAQFTRACAYSRAGIMWSDRKDGLHDGLAAAHDLHSTLEAAGEKGPFVLVGHSLGGPYITIFTKHFGDEVAGLVYVDASHPDQIKLFDAALPGKHVGSAGLPTVVRVAACLSWTGVARFISLFEPLDVNPNMPPEVVNTAEAFISKSLGTVVSEADAFSATLDEAGQFRALGSRPIVVLTAMKPPSETELETAGLSKVDGERMRSIWLAMHRDMASWSSRSAHRVLDDASHAIQFDRPDAVIAAVREVVDSVRADTHQHF